jgi:type II secretory pathway pseudopilin PulG
MQVEQSVEDGVTYYAVSGTPPKPSKPSYAFFGGYLIAGSSHAAVAEAVRSRVSGASLTRSTQFLDSFPPGQSTDASAIFYEDPTALAAAQLRKGPPDVRTSLAQLSDQGSAVVAVYGDGSAIRAVSTSPGLDVGAVGVVAAIAIPNLMRSRIAANEASAVGGIRTINTAQVSYQMSYPDRGFARDLATLGPDPKSPAFASAEHAGLIDEKLGNASCVEGKWCTNSGFRFSVTAVCKQAQCTEFVAVAKPVTSNTGTRSFCSTSDAIIRVKQGPPLNESVSAAECQGWKLLK